MTDAATSDVFPARQPRDRRAKPLLPEERLAGEVVAARRVEILDLPVRDQRLAWPPALSASLGMARRRSWR